MFFIEIFVLFVLHFWGFKTYSHVDTKQKNKEIAYSHYSSTKLKNDFDNALYFISYQKIKWNTVYSR